MHRIEKVMLTNVYSRLNVISWFYDSCDDLQATVPDSKDSRHISMVTNKLSYGILKEMIHFQFFIQMLLQLNPCYIFASHIKTPNALMAILAVQNRG